MADIIQAVKNELAFENVLVTAMKVPGVKINRATIEAEFSVAEDIIDEDVNIDNYI